MLTIDESLRLLNIPVARFEVASSISEFRKKVKLFKFPVVLKLVSSGVVHKSDVGGVVFADSISEAERMASQLLKRGSVLIQEKLSGVELFLGIKKDASFGHVIIAGIGGVFVEVYRDLSFRVCPVARKDAREMIDELKGRALLDGIRSMPKVDKGKLVDIIVELSRLPAKLPNIVELDINPLIADGKSIRAVDARIRLSD